MILGRITTPSLSFSHMLIRISSCRQLQMYDINRSHREKSAILHHSVLHIVVSHCAILDFALKPNLFI